MRRSLPSPGFSLVELLVAISILSLLALMITGIINATSRTTRLSSQRVDAATQTRLVFDRLGLDLAALVKRPDVDFKVDASSSTIFTFISGVGSSGSWTANRRSSVVSYQMSTSTLSRGSDGQGRLCLLRASVPIQLNDVGFFGLKSNGLPLLFSDSAFPASLLPQHGDYDVLAQGVFRIAIGFQLYPDNKSVKLLDGATLATATGQIVYSPPIRTVTATDASGATATPVDLNRVASIVIALASIDLQNLILLKQADVDALANAFPMPTTTLNMNQLPAELWTPIANNAATLPASVPLPARQGIRIFQRYYPITPYGSIAP